MIQMNHNPPVKNTITKSNNIPKQPDFFCLLMMCMPLSIFQQMLVVFPMQSLRVLPTHQIQKPDSFLVYAEILFL